MEKPFCATQWALAIEGKVSRHIKLNEKGGDNGTVNNRN